MTPRHWHHQGFAETRFDNRQLVVWEGIPGEEAEVVVRHDGNNRIRTEWTAPTGQPHPGRRSPPCERYRPCGSCPLMHLDPDAQRGARLALVASALDQVGLAELAPEAVVPSPDGEEDYRHVVKLAVGMSDRGRVRVGAFRRGSRQVVAIPDCIVATPQLRAAMRIVARGIIDLDIHGWSPQAGGTLRYVVLRQSRATGRILCTLVAGRPNRYLDRLVERIMTVDSHIVGVHLHLNDHPGNAIFHTHEDQTSPGFMRLEGARTIDEELVGAKLAVGPGDFYQANPAMAERIAHDILAAFAPWQERPVVDLYCGVGAFSMVLARAHGYLLGVERGEGAVARAKVNAATNKVQAEFFAGTVAERLPELRSRVAGKGPVVLVDPARRGLEDGVIDAILELEPSAVGYLSCNPMSLARDMRTFLDRGWVVDGISAYDMFPQTSHVETFALLRPASAPKVDGRGPRRRIVSRGGAPRS